MLKLIATTVACASVVVGVGLAAPTHADSYTAMFDAVDFLAHKYGVSAYTTHEPMEYGTYGATYGNLIVFNTGYINNPDLLHADVAADVWSGFHRGMHCSPEQMVAAHEYAHVLDNATDHTARSELVQALAEGLSGEVSGYSLNDDGTVNYPEALANAFVAVECDVPTPAEQTIYVMLTT